MQKPPPPPPHCCAKGAVAGVAVGDYDAVDDGDDDAFGVDDKCSCDCSDCSGSETLCDTNCRRHC